VPFAMVLRIFNVSLLALAVFCCIDTVAGFRAAHLPLSAQQQSARCTPLQLCTTPPARVARARPWLAVFVASSVIAMPTLALASVTSAGEHLHLGQKIALFFKRTGLPDWAVLLLISMAPAVELRGGVPVGNWLGLSPLVTFVICVAGNMLPILPTLLALRSEAVKKMAAPLLKRAESKLAALPTGQSRSLALALFVGIPAPGTGAWTGAIIASLLEMPLEAAMGSILAGVVLAGLIMTTLTLAGKAGALIALAAMCVAGAGAIRSALNKETTAEAPAPAEAEAETVAEEPQLPARWEMP